MIARIQRKLAVTDQIVLGLGIVAGSVVAGFVALWKLL